MAKKSVKKSYHKVSIKRASKKKWYHLSIFRFSVASVVVLAAVAMLAGGIYNVLPKGADVLGTKTTNKKSYGTPADKISLAWLDYSCTKSGYQLTIHFNTSYIAANHHFDINVVDQSTQMPYTIFQANSFMAHPENPKLNNNTLKYSYYITITIGKNSGFMSNDKLSVQVWDNDIFIPFGSLNKGSNPMTHEDTIRVPYKDCSAPISCSSVSGGEACNNGNLCLGTTVNSCTHKVISYKSCKPSSECPKPAPSPVTHTTTNSTNTTSTSTIHKSGAMY